MSVLRYYGCIDLCIRILGSLVCNISLISDLCLVLCCDIYRSTLISIMYPACMITVHDRKSRALHKVISFHIALNVIMLIIYNGFNTFINFPVFSVLLDPLNEIPSIFNAPRLKYPTRGGIKHLLNLMRKHGIKKCKYNLLGELMIRTFEH